MAFLRPPGTEDGAPAPPAGLRRRSGRALDRLEVNPADQLQFPSQSAANEDVQEQAQALRAPRTSVGGAVPAIGPRIVSDRRLGAGQGSMKGDRSDRTSRLATDVNAH